MGRIIIPFLLCFNVLASEIKIGDCYKYNKEYFLIKSKTTYGYFTYFFNEHKRLWLSISEIQDMTKIDCKYIEYKR